jgi:hypothetical protein
MKSLELNFYGIKVFIECDSGLADKLSLDFSYFKNDPASVLVDGVTVNITASADNGIIPPPPAKRFKFKVHDFAFFDSDGVRHVEYGERGMGEYDFSQEKGRLSSRDPGLLHELAYLMILSRVGEILDRHGVHRVHALGGSLNRMGFLVVMPQGGGKTTLGLGLLDIAGFALFSDDAPLVTGSGKIYPFPVRIGVNKKDEIKVPAGFVGKMERRKFGEKSLIDIEYYKNRIAVPGMCSLILFAKRGGKNAPTIHRVGALTGFWYLFKPLILGIGVPQVIEYFIRFDFLDIISKIRILYSRSAAVVKLVSNSKLAALTLSDDAKVNASFVADYITRVKP